MKPKDILESLNDVEDKYVITSKEKVEDKNCKEADCVNEDNGEEGIIMLSGGRSRFIKIAVVIAAIIIAALLSAVVYKVVKDREESVADKEKYNNEEIEKEKQNNESKENKIDDVSKESTEENDFPKYGGKYEYDAEIMRQIDYYEIEKVEEYIASGELKKVEKDTAINKYSVGEEHSIDLDCDGNKESICITNSNEYLKNLVINGVEYATELSYFKQFSFESFYIIYGYSYEFNYETMEVNEKNKKCYIALESSDISDETEHYVLFEYNDGNLCRDNVIYGNPEQYDCYEYGYFYSNSVKSDGAVAYRIGNPVSEVGCICGDYSNVILSADIGIKGNVDLFIEKDKKSQKYTASYKDYPSEDGYDGKSVYLPPIKLGGNGWISVLTPIDSINVDLTEVWIYLPDYNGKFSVPTDNVY